MNKCIWIAAGLLHLGTAAAQTSISVYGVVDVGIQMSRFGSGTQSNLASGIADGSRIGFKGREDMGGGYAALVQLEARLEADTGGMSNGYMAPYRSVYLTRGLNPSIASALAPRLMPRTVVNPDGALFDRTSMVGIATPAGAVLLGRQYTPAYEVAAMSDTFETGTAAGWGQVLQGAGGVLTPGVAIRANNAIQYRLEKNGLGAAAMLGLRQTGSLNLSKRFYGANLRIRNQDWNIGAAYQREQNQNGQASLSTVMAGGSYLVGRFKVFGGYARMRNDNSVIEPLLMPLIGVANAAIVGANTRLDARSVTMGTQFKDGNRRFLVSISRTNDAASRSNVSLYGVGYGHELSRRTDLYGVFSHARNKGNAQYALGGAGYLGGFAKAPEAPVSALQFGIRHRW